ncbi:MAG: SMC-Scp complex subunit ScpB [candidate division KSB1 bacterium]|nr:SMC-Scp complex subunit ScpB [candidate division KSB1 bacterium]
MDTTKLAHILEALIFASDSPISLKQLSAIVKEASADNIEQALEQIKTDCENRGIVLKKIAGGYQFATRAEYAQWVGNMLETKASSRLSRAALEALAIVAFKQPISRVEVSAIRGVNSDGVMKKLLDLKLITIAGRDEGQGRALLFKTTTEFLQYFDINDISDLPRPKEIEELLAEGEGGKLLQELPEGISNDAEESSEDPDDKVESAAQNDENQ